MTRRDAIVRLGVLDGFLGLQMRLAYERTWQDFVDRLGADAMRPGYFTMLTLVALNPGISQTTIARVAGRDRSSVTKALRWMEDEGLITRLRVDDDRRTHAVRVTEAGRDRQARMEAAARAHLEGLDRVIGAERHDAFLDVLRTINDAYDPKADGRSTRRSAP